MAKILLPALVLIAAALLIDAPALRGGWIWDDDLLVASNADLRTLPGLARLWFAAPATDYWPLTWTLLWLEWHLWGDAPLSYHLGTLALHIGSGLLLWRVLGRLGLRHTWLGGLLFVVHPLAVESVAWISEIKNTLSLPLFLLACDAWLDAEEGKPTGYARSMLFYLLALLAKTSTIMLPLVLALYCWWKRGRITRVELLRLLPCAVIALIFGAITVHFQSHGDVNSGVTLNAIVPRVIGAGTAICFYLGKFLWPINLLPIYPRWDFDPPSLLQVLTLPALAALPVLLWTQRATWGRHALFGFGFFLVNLLPVIGLVRMMYSAISPVADHLVYLPMIGLVALVAALLDRIAERIPASLHPVAVGTLALALAAIAWQSRTNAARFANADTFWTYALEHNPEAWSAHNGLGSVLMDSGHLPEAIAQFDQALQLNPDSAEAHFDLGNAEFQLGHLPEAIAQYENAARLRPRDARINYNLANAERRAGRIADALAHYQQAIDLSPDAAEIHDNFATALMQSGHAADGIAQYEQALQIDPTRAGTHYNLGLALLHLGRTTEALAQFQQALQLKPDFPSARKLLEQIQASPSG
jgi:Flp pilus assembly protein TadD